MIQCRGDVGVYLCMLVAMYEEGKGDSNALNDAGKDHRDVTLAALGFICTSFIFYVRLASPTLITKLLKSLEANNLHVGKNTVQTENV